MAKPKYFSILIPILVLILLVGGFCFAAKQLEIEYPQIPGVPSAETPQTTETFLPNYIKYLFNFSIMIAGLVAFGSIVYGGTRYLTSAGDPSKMGDARDQIFSAAIGLVILFASYMILTTINPELVVLKLEKESSGLTGEATPPEMGMKTCPEGAVVCLYGEKKTDGWEEIDPPARAFFKIGDKTSQPPTANDVYAVQIKGGAAVRFWGESDYEGRNICFKESIKNLNECAFADDAWPGHDGWENQTHSLEIITSDECKNPNTTLEEDGTPAKDSIPCICHPGFNI